MGSKEIKDNIVEFYNSDYCKCKNSVASDWKRLFKKNVTIDGEINTLRLFENSKTKDRIYSLNEGEDFSEFFPRFPDDHLVYVLTDPDDNIDGYTVEFNPSWYNHTWDLPSLMLIKAMFQFPKWVSLYEEAENCNYVELKEDKTIDDFEKLLQSFGMKKG